MNTRTASSRHNWAMPRRFSKTTWVKECEQTIRRFLTHSHWESSNFQQPTYLISQSTDSRQQFVVFKFETPLLLLELRDRTLINLCLCFSLESFDSVFLLLPPKQT